MNPADHASSSKYSESQPRKVDEVIRMLMTSSKPGSKGSPSSGLLSKYTVDDMCFYLACAFFVQW